MTRGERERAAQPPAVAFLHGLGTGPDGWEPQAKEFRKTRPVLTPAVAGDLESVFAPLDEFADRNGGAIDLVGLSLGGIAALTYAARRTTVRRLVVCAGFISLPPALRRRVVRTSKLIAVLPAAAVRRGLTADVPEPFSGSAQQALARLRSSEIARTMRRVAQIDLSDELAAITCATLVLCGSGDTANLPLSKRLAEALAMASFAEIPGARHVANLDSPEAFTHIVRDFLDR